MLSLSRQFLCIMFYLRCCSQLATILINFFCNQSYCHSCCKLFCIIISVPSDIHMCCSFHTSTSECHTRFSNLRLGSDTCVLFMFCVVLSWMRPNLDFERTFLKYEQTRKTWESLTAVIMSKHYPSLLCRVSIRQFVLPHLPYMEDCSLTDTFVTLCFVSVLE
jgi:hypothetical protein